MAIDYARAKREGPKLKRRLTLALKKENEAEREVAVYGACVAAVLAWERWGAWPDDWSHWQRALDDAYPLFQAPRLEDLR